MKVFCSYWLRPILRLQHTRTGISCHPPRKESLQEEMARLAANSQTSVSLKATLDTGLGLLLRKDTSNEEMTQQQRMLIQIATFLKRELPVRLARRAIELQQLPEGLHSMPSVCRVREWYEQSFADIRRSRYPICPQSEEVKHIHQSEPFLCPTRTVTKLRSVQGISQSASGHL